MSCYARSYSLHECTLAFWPRFLFSKNARGNQVKLKDMLTLRLAPMTECQGGSRCDSQIGWRPYVCKVLPGCITAHSKTPTNVHITGLNWGLGTGVEWGWGEDGVRMGGGWGWIGGGELGMSLFSVRQA